MSDEKPGTPVTQEWLVAIFLGYFIIGPILMLVVIGIVAFLRWLL